MTLLEQAPPLRAQSLTGDYRLLADFNRAVLAAHPTRLGVQFVTWDWSCLLYTSQWETDVFFGVLPKYDSKRTKLTFTVKQLSLIHISPTAHGN